VIGLLDSVILARRSARVKQANDRTDEVSSRVHSPRGAVRLPDGLATRRVRAAVKRGLGHCVDRVRERVAPRERVEAGRADSDAISTNPSAR
jgi:hypothetical protein